MLHYYVGLQAKLQKLFHMFVEVLHVKQHNQKMNDSDLTSPTNLCFINYNEAANIAWKNQNDNNEHYSYEQ